VTIEGVQVSNPKAIHREYRDLLAHIEIRMTAPEWRIRLWCKDGSAGDTNPWVREGTAPRGARRRGKRGSLASSMLWLMSSRKHTAAGFPGEKGIGRLATHRSDSFLWVANEDTEDPLNGTQDPVE